MSGRRETRGILTQSQPSQSAPPYPRQLNSPPPSVTSDFPTELLEKFDEVIINVFADRRPKVAAKQVASTGNQETANLKSAQCPRCSRTIKLTKDLMLHPHGPPGNRCTLSGQSPFEKVNCEADIRVREDSIESAIGIVHFMNISRRRILKLFPKTSRITVSAALRDTLNAILDSPNSKIAWLRLFVFPTLCLQAPLRAGKSHKQSLATQVNNRITIFMQNRDIVLLKTRTKSKQSSNHQTDVEQLMKRVSEKLDEGDVKGVVRLARSDNGILELSEEILSKLREKHPSRPLDPSFPIRRTSAVPSQRDPSAHGIEILSRGVSWWAIWPEATTFERHHEPQSKWWPSSTKILPDFFQ